MLGTALPGDAQLSKIGADLVKYSRDTRRRGQQVELVGAPRAVLQQRRGGIAAGIDLDSIDRDAGRLDIGAGAGAVARLIHTVVDWRLRDVPAVFGVQAVRQQDDDFIVGVIAVFGRDGEHTATAQREPAPDDADRLVGVAVRLHLIDQAVHSGPVVAQLFQRQGAGQILLGRIERARVGGDRRVDGLVISRVAGRGTVGTTIGDAAVPAGVSIVAVARAGDIKGRAVPLIERAVIANGVASASAGQRPSFRIDAVHWKDRFGDVETDCLNRLHAWLL